MAVYSPELPTFRVSSLDYMETSFINTSYTKNDIVDINWINFSEFCVFPLFSWFVLT